MALPSFHWRRTSTAIASVRKAAASSGRLNTRARTIAASPAGPTPKIPARPVGRSLAALARRSWRCKTLRSLIKDGDHISAPRLGDADSLDCGESVIRSLLQKSMSYTRKRPSRCLPLARGTGTAESLHRDDPSRFLHHTPPVHRGRVHGASGRSLLAHRRRGGRSSRALRRGARQTISRVPHFR